MTEHAGQQGHTGHHGEADPAVVEAVEHVRDRFGAHGLRDMIALAQHELAVAEAALADLARLGEEGDADRYGGTPDEPYGDTHRV